MNWRGEREREREREKEGRIRGLLGFSWEGNKLFIFCLNGDVLLFGYICIQAMLRISILTNSNFIYILDKNENIA